METHHSRSWDFLNGVLYRQIVFVAPSYNWLFLKVQLKALLHVFTIKMWYLSLGKM